MNLPKVTSESNPKIIEGKAPQDRLDQEIDLSINSAEENQAKKKKTQENLLQERKSSKDGQKNSKKLTDFKPETRV